MTLRAWAYLFVAVALLGIGGALFAKGMQVGADRAQARFDRELVEKLSAVAAQTKRILTDEANNNERAVKRDAELVLAVDRARPAADRLRRSSLAIRANDHSGPSIGNATTAAQLLAECGDYVEWLAGEADRRTLELTRLQEWARAIQQAKP